MGGGGESFHALNGGAHKVLPWGGGEGRKMFQACALIVHYMFSAECMFSKI